MADSITEEVGEFVVQDETIATIETDKVDVQVNSPESGVVVEWMAKVGDAVQVGADLIKIDTEGKKTTTTAATPPPPKPIETKKEVKQETAPPPPVAVKKIKSPAALEAKSSPSSDAKAKVHLDGDRTERRVKMNRMRLRISERLKESQNTAASLTTFNELDMTNLMEMRGKYKDEMFEKHGVKLGFMSAFVKASVVALQAIPAVNASIEEDEIIFRDYCDISVAVSTPKGLVTPVLRNAELRSFLEVEKEISALGTKARDGKLTIEDMAGGTFTISNGGVFGSLLGTPIINVPQSAILGMHAVKDRAVVVDGKVVSRPMMYVALTYDHRLIDGREAVTFLKTIKECIEDPRRLLLQ